MSLSSKNPKCDTKNRVILYTGGALHSVVCPQPPVSDRHRVAEVFSNGWVVGESDDLTNSALSVLKDEESEKVLRAKSVIVEYLGKEDGQYSVTWLELGRR